MEIPSKKCIVCGSFFFNTRLNKKGQRIRKWTKERWKVARFCSFSCRNKILKYRLGKITKNTGYSGLHKWARCNIGKHPIKCEICGEIGKINGTKWSIHYANISKKYKREKEDWKCLCTKCHRNYDKNFKQ